MRFSFAGTQELRVQVENGARADVLAAADHKHLDALVQAGLAQRPVLFALNRPVLIVPASNPAKLQHFSQLPQAPRIVVGVPEVPIGAYTAQILDRADRILGPNFRSRVLARVVSRELNVKQIVAKVVLGEADAAFVYETDARAAGNKVAVLAVPDGLNPVAQYPIAILREAANQPLAQAWIDTLLSEVGRKLLREAGFRLPPPAASDAQRAR